MCGKTKKNFTDIGEFFFSSNELNSKMCKAPATNSRQKIAVECCGPHLFDKGDIEHATVGSPVPLDDPHHSARGLQGVMGHLFGLQLKVQSDLD